jgi:hypothetical protein
MPNTELCGPFFPPRIASLAMKNTSIPAVSISSSNIVLFNELVARDMESKQQEEVYVLA